MGTPPRRGGRTTVLLTVALLTGAAVGLVGCDGSPPSSPSPETSAARQPVAPVRGAQAPGGGALRLVEAGVSMTTDELGDQMATYGIVLENTSPGQAAFNADVAITLLDADGQPVTDRLQNTTRVTETLLFAPPGQRVSLGRYTYVEGGPVASVKVEVGDTSWLPASEVRVATLTTSDLTTSISGEDQPIRVRFTVDNGYPVNIRRVAMALFRDATGKVVGGTGPEELRGSLGAFPPGRSQGEIRSIGGPPPGIDPSRTEVSVHPSTEAFRLG